MITWSTDISPQVQLDCSHFVILLIGYLSIPVDLQILNVHVSMLWALLDLVTATEQMHLLTNHTLHPCTTTCYLAGHHSYNHIRDVVAVQNIVFMGIIISYNIKRYGFPIAKKTCGQPSQVSTYMCHKRGWRFYTLCDSTAHRSVSF